MTALRSPPDDTLALWPFACALYEAPGVSEAAIMLQDRHLVDVNMMLFLCWVAGFEERTVSQRDLGPIIAATTPLQDGAIRRIRAERRAIPKGGEREEERRRLLALELAAEKAELELLEELWRKERPWSADREAVITAALANLRLYFGMRGIDPDNDTMRALGHMAHSAGDIHTNRQNLPSLDGRGLRGG